MRCSRISELLSKYVSREIDPYEMALVDSHLTECFRCRSELAKMSRTVRALEMPVRQFEAPNMLAEIKRRAAHPDRILFPAFSVRAIAAAALMALIVLSAAVLPHLVHGPRKAEMTYKPNVIVLPPIHASKQPEVAKVVRNVKQIHHSVPKRMPVIRKTINRIARVNKTDCGVRVTIMDPAQFEASRVESSAHASVIISDSPNSAQAVDHQLASPMIANSSDVRRREPAWFYRPWLRDETKENRNELP